MTLSPSDIAGLYNEANVRGASSIGLVVALYDTILRDLRRAGDAIAQGDIEKRTFELNHALRVIAELENVLDYERGGKVAAELQRFYATTRGMILEASIRSSRQAVGQIAALFGTVRQAWHAADEKMNGKGKISAVVAAQLQASSSTTTRTLGAEPSEAPRGNWRA